VTPPAMAWDSPFGATSARWAHRPTMLTAAFITKTIWERMCLHVVSLLMHTCNHCVRHLQSMLEGIGVQKKDAGNITGTNADLRKLSMKESMRILKGYGATEEEVKGAHLSWWRLAKHPSGFESI
jgi:hypothetical protein